MCAGSPSRNIKRNYSHNCVSVTQVIAISSITLYYRIITEQRIQRPQENLVLSKWIWRRPDLPKKTDTVPNDSDSKRKFSEISLYNSQFSPGRLEFTRTAKLMPTFCL